MKQEEITRKNLDNQEYSKLRQASEKIADFLNKRLSEHLEVIRPLFITRKLLGHYIKSAFKEDIPGSDKAFAELQKQYSAVCGKPFGLTKKLEPPLAYISNNLEVTPFQYSLYIKGSEDRHISITSPVRWILSYLSDSSLNRLRDMISGKELRQLDDMKQALINHIIPVIFLKHFPELQKLLEDLNYQVKIIELADLGGLPVVTLNAPVEIFLPPDDFIFQVTQLSGIAAFQEIIDLDAVENITDPLKDNLRNLIG